LNQAVEGFASLEGMDPELAEKLVGEGFLSYDDLSVIEPTALMELGNLTEEQAQQIIDQAEVRAEEAEQAAAKERRAQREQERLAAATAEAEAAERRVEAERAAESAAAPVAEPTPPAAEATEEQGG
jgi:N utilization substance protein A